jgi:hypothetical protein
MKIHKNRHMIPKYVEVQSDDFEEIITYETEDGKIFDKDSLQEAKIHEHNLKMAKIEKRIFEDFIPVDDCWYKVKNQEEMDFIKEWYSDSKGVSISGQNKIKIGEWFCVHNLYAYDSTDVYTFVTLKEFKSNFEDFLNIFE